MNILIAIVVGVTLKVPTAEYPTIQSAVDAAAGMPPGVTITVAKGEYFENVSISAIEGLVLRGKGKAVVKSAIEAAAPVIHVDLCVDTEITKLTVEGGSPGILVEDCDGVVVSKCKVLNADTEGIRVSGGGNVVVEKNTVDTTGNFGIALFDVDLLGGPTNSSVIKNKVFDTGNDAIISDGSDNLIEKNKVDGSAGDGLESRGPSLRISFIKNRVKMHGEGARGLAMFGDDNVSEKNKLLEPGGIGLMLSGDGTTCTKDKIVRPGSHGIEINTDDNVLMGVKATQPGGDGCVIAGENNCLEKVKISKPGQRGFFVECGNNELTGCKSSKATTDGFDVVSTGNTFTANRGSKSGGLDLNDTSGGPNTYVDNKFKTSNIVLP